MSDPYTVAHLLAALERCPRHFHVYVDHRPLGCLRRAPDSLRVYLHSPYTCRDILALKARRLRRRFFLTRDMR